MALQTWCVQCGAQSRPVVAVGYDADGDPACVGHQVRAKKPLIIEEVQTSTPPPKVDETEVSVHSFPPEFQNVPSPGTEAPAQEEVMRARPAFAERKCACCGEVFIPTGATQRFAFGHKPKREQVGKRAYRIQLKEPLPQLADPVPVQIHEPPNPPSEATVVIALKFSQIQKLLELLLQ